MGSYEMQSATFVSMVLAAGALVGMLTHA